MTARSSNEIWRGWSTPARRGSTCRRAGRGRRGGGERALGDGTAAAYALTEDGAELVLAAGRGPQTLPAPGLEPMLRGRPARCCRWSAHAAASAASWSTASATQDGLERGARMAAGIAAQAVEASRLWESAGAGAGTHDLLTGLPNHHGFQGVLARELARAKRTGPSLAVSVVDLDGLAGYNQQPRRRRGRPRAAAGRRVPVPRRAQLRLRLPAGRGRVRAGAARDDRRVGGDAGRPAVRRRSARGRSATGR